MKSVKRSSAGGFAVSFTLAAVICLLLGLFMFLAPNTSRKLLCTLIGVGVILYGVLSFLPFVLSRGERRFTPSLLLGACALALGVFSLIQPTFLMDFLFTVLGIVVCVTSICGIRRALNLRYFGFSRWWAPLTANLAALLLALAIIFFPGFFGNMLMRVMGALLTVEAASDLISLYFLGKLSERATVSYHVSD